MQINTVLVGLHNSERIRYISKQYLDVDAYKTSFVCYGCLKDAAQTSLYTNREGSKTNNIWQAFNTKINLCMSWMS